MLALIILYSCLFVLVWLAAKAKPTAPFILFLAIVLTAAAIIFETVRQTGA